MSHSSLAKKKKAAVSPLSFCAAENNDATDAVDVQGILEEHVREARLVCISHGEPLGCAFQLLGPRQRAQQFLQPHPVSPTPLIATIIIAVHEHSRVLMLSPGMRASRRSSTTTRRSRSRLAI